MPGQDQGPLLRSFHFWLSPQPGALGSSPDPQHLVAAIAAHLADGGVPGAEPLRWAITAVDPERGWCLEGVAITAAASPLP